VTRRPARPPRRIEPEIFAPCPQRLPCSRLLGPTTPSRCPRCGAVNGALRRSRLHAGFKPSAESPKFMKTATREMGQDWDHLRDRCHHRTFPSTFSLRPLREEKQDPLTQPVTRRHGHHRDLGIGFEISVPKELLPLPAKHERAEDRGEGQAENAPLSGSLPTRASRGERENGVMPVLSQRPVNEVKLYWVAP